MSTASWLDRNSQTYASRHQTRTASVASMSACQQCRWATTICVMNEGLLPVGAERPDSEQGSRPSTLSPLLPSKPFTVPAFLSLSPQRPAAPPRFPVSLNVTFTFACSRSAAASYSPFNPLPILSGP
eukprot:6174352-Pleurochrysis_carterae.AAC.3